MSTVSAYIVCADEAEAERIARTLVEEKLAACVNILGPCRSIYRWEGKIEEAGEVAMIAKTSLEIAEALVARTVELHGYDNPAVTVWPIIILPTAYGDWVEENSPGNPPSDA